MKKISLIFIAVLIIAVAVYAQTTTTRTETSSHKKYVYAELYLNDLWDRAGGNPREMWVNSSHVSDQMKQTIKTKKYTNDALDLLGADGWELITVNVIEVSLGSQYQLYLKKERK